jgi:hypothetical protein
VKGWGAIEWCVDTAKVRNVVLRNNLVYGGELTQDRLCNCGGEPHQRFILAEADVTLANNLTGDPLFVNPTPGVDDYHLRSGSPAIDSGIATQAPDQDRDGKARPSGVGYDLGAYEAGGPSGPAAALPEGDGIAARYPDDRGIDQDPAVVFAEDFEVRALDELKARWTSLVTHYPVDERKSALALRPVVATTDTGILLPYVGSAPDVGAWEFEGEN